MAVKHKIGLDYFSFDIDFFNDEKIEFVAARFGTKGELIAVKLLCKIYRNGYFAEWKEDDAIMFAKRVGDGITPALVNDVVNELAKRGFFDKDILSRFGVLTSTGIQKRYFEAVERRKFVDALNHLLLIDVDKYENVNIIEQNVNIKRQNANNNSQRKGNKSKEEESKEEGGEPPTPKNFKQWTEKEFIEEIGKCKDQYPYELRNAFFKYWKEKSAGGKMKFQLEKTWETELRLDKWQSNDEKFNSQKKSVNATNTSGRTNQKTAGAERLAAELRSELETDAG